MPHCVLISYPHLTHIQTTDEVKVLIGRVAKLTPECPVSWKCQRAGTIHAIVFFKSPHDAKTLIGRKSAPSGARTVLFTRPTAIHYAAALHTLDPTALKTTSPQSAFVEYLLAREILLRKEANERKAAWKAAVKDAEAKATLAEARLLAMLKERDAWQARAKEVQAELEDAEDAFGTQLHYPTSPTQTLILDQALRTARHLVSARYD